MAARQRSRRRKPARVVARWYCSPPPPPLTRIAMSGTFSLGRGNGSNKIHMRTHRVAMKFLPISFVPEMPPFVWIRDA